MGSPRGGTPASARGRESARSPRQRGSVGAAPPPGAPRAALGVGGPPWRRCLSLPPPPPPTVLPLHRTVGPGRIPAPRGPPPSFPPPHRCVRRRARPAARPPRPAQPRCPALPAPSPHPRPPHGECVGGGSGGPHSGERGALRNAALCPVAFGAGGVWGARGVRCRRPRCGAVRG